MKIVEKKCHLAANKHFAIILIPAYQPDSALLDLMRKIYALRPEQKIIVVNDGSDQDRSAEVFARAEKLGALVLEHAVNLGKGETIKTGLSYFLAHYINDSPGVVTADADGQHRAQDVITICEALEDAPDSLHLGVRKFRSKEIPWRSRFGNKLTGWLFRMITRSNLEDTQTGLRAIPGFFAKELVASRLRGYEFELEMLLLASRKNIKMHYVDIMTIYHDHNASSHFNPLFDSLKIYFVFIRFAAISILSAILDFALFSLNFFLFHSLIVSIAVARVVSGVFNYKLNKNSTFKSNSKTLTSALKYILLATSIVFVSYLLIGCIHGLGVNIYLSKCISEVLLFITSFSIQRLFVFKRW